MCFEQSFLNGSFCLRVPFGGIDFQNPNLLELFFLSDGSPLPGN